MRNRIACTFVTAYCHVTAKLTPSAISLSDGFEMFNAPPVPANFTGTILSQNINFRPGMVQQYNVNIERQVPGDLVLTVGYAGSRATHILIDGNNINIQTPNACGTVPGYTLGCGPGGLSRRIMKRLGEGGVLVGVDCSEGLLNQARGALAGSGPGRLLS